MLDDLIGSIPAADRQQAEQLRERMSLLRKFLQNPDSTHPYENLTHFLLHAFFLLAPPISDNVCQLLLYILHHPQFRLDDVPKSVYQLRSLDKLLPIVEPGMRALSFFASSCLSERFTVSATVTKVARAAPTEPKRAPLQTTRTVQLSIDYISPLGKLEQFFNNPEKRYLVPSIFAHFFMQACLAALWSWRRRLWRVLGFAAGP